MKIEEIVAEFHEKLAISPQSEMSKLEDHRHVAQLSTTLHSWSKQMYKDYERFKQPQLLRLHLILEETAELCDSFIANDELGALDALADLVYVTAGTGSVFRLPLTEAFIEVHRSNMTKERQLDDPQGDRVRDKGPNYDPPNLQRILDKARGVVTDMEVVDDDA